MPSKEDALHTVHAVVGALTGRCPAELPPPHRLAAKYACQGVALTALLAVGPGYQTLPALLLPTLAFMLVIARSCEAWWHAALVLWPALTLGSFFAYAGTLSESTPFAKGAWISVLVITTILFGLHAAALVLDRAFVRQTQAYRTDVFSFPLIWAGFSTVLYHLSPFGDFGTWGPVLSLVRYDPLTIGATWLGGSVTGGAFVSALAASALAKLYELLTAPSAPPEAPEAAAARAQWSTWRAHLFAAAAALLAVATVGSGVMLLSLYPRAVYQTPVQDYAPEFLRVACLTETNFTETERFLSGRGAGTQLLLWSETSLGDDVGVDEATVIEAAKTMSAKHDVMLGVTYLSPVDADGDVEEAARNMFALILPPPPGSGPDAAATVGFTYQKSHPVPIVEDELEAGALSVPYVDTPFGRIGGAICFDFDFPFLSQAYAKGVDIMLQPSWTWGAMGGLHETYNRLRAVENGFMHVRCSSLGVSGVYDPALGVTARKITLEKGDGFVAEMPLVGRRWTFVGATGGLPGVAAVAAFCGIALFMLLRGLLEVPRVREWLEAAAGRPLLWLPKPSPPVLNPSYVRVEE